MKHFSLKSAFIGLLLLAAQACTKKDTVSPASELAVSTSALSKKSALSAKIGEDGRAVMQHLEYQDVESEDGQPAARLLAPLPGHCYEVYLVYTDLSTGEVIGEQHLYYYGTCGTSGGDGGGPSGGGGGGAGPSPSPDPSQIPPQQPCDIVANLAGNTTYDLLAANMANYAKTSPAEIAYTYALGGNYPLIASTVGTAGAVNPLFPRDPTTNQYVPVDGFMHTHPSGDIPTFSLSDLLFIYQMYRDGQIADISIFSGQLYTPTATYMVTVNDFNALMTWGASVTANASYLYQAENIFGNSNGNYKINTQSSQSVAENGLARFLKDQGTGLTLSKLTKGTKGSPGGWATMTPQANGTVTTTPCVN